MPNNNKSGFLADGLARKHPCHRDDNKRGIQYLKIGRVKFENETKTKLYSIQALQISHYITGAINYLFSRLKEEG